MKVLFLSLLVTLGCKYGSASEHSEGHQLRAVDEDREWEPRIVGGQDASKGEFPFFVQGRGCGASLIWKDIVLCASHCKGAVGNFRGRVLVGATEKDDEDSHSEWMKILGNGEFTHPDYDGDVYKDYMILKLSQEVTNPNIKTVGLAGDTTVMNEGDELTVIGFGALREGALSGSSTLQKVNVGYVSESRCRSVYGNEDAYDPNYMFCAGGTPSGGTDSCQGDSGGPIIDQNGYQVGVVSWGYGCAQPGIPGVYATVSAEIEWIKAMVCEYAQNPPDWACEGGTSPVPPTYMDGSSPTPPSPTPPSPTPPSPTPPTNPTNPAPSPSGYDVKVVVAHDNYPEETSWYLVDDMGTEWLSQATGSITKDEEVVSKVATVPAGEYTFEIEDSYADGICCTHGFGSYEVFVNGERLFSGGSFGDSSNQVFCIDAETGKASEGGCGDGEDIDNEDFEEEFPWWCFWCY